MRHLLRAHKTVYPVQYSLLFPSIESSQLKNFHSCSKNCCFCEKTFDCLDSGLACAINMNPDTFMIRTILARFLIPTFKLTNLCQIHVSKYKMLDTLKQNLGRSVNITNFAKNSSFTQKNSNRNLNFNNTRNIRSKLCNKRRSKKQDFTFRTTSGIVTLSCYMI